MMTRILVCLAALLAAGVPLSAQISNGVLPTGQIVVDVLEQWAPPRLGELSLKLQRAAQADPAWWQGHVRNAQPGEPLPYDIKMGLSEAEYRELLALTDSVRMRPARVDTLTVTGTPTGFRLHGSARLEALTGVEIDTVRNVVVTHFGELAAANPITPSDAQRATGRWGGPRWQLESLDEATVTGVVANFAVGRHESGRTIIYYDARQANNGRPTARESHFLMLHD